MKTKTKDNLLLHIWYLITETTIRKTVIVYPANPFIELIDNEKWYCWKFKVLLPKPHSNRSSQSSNVVFHRRSLALCSNAVDFFMKFIVYKINITGRYARIFLAQLFLEFCNKSRIFFFFYIQKSHSYRFKRLVTVAVGRGSKLYPHHIVKIIKYRLQLT